MKNNATLSKVKNAKVKTALSQLMKWKCKMLRLSNSPENILFFSVLCKLNFTFSFVSIILVECEAA